MDEGGIGIRVLVCDSFYRIRDCKEGIALKKVYGSKIEFVLVKTTDRNDNEDKMPGMKVYRIDSTKDPIGQITKICKDEHIDVLHTHNYPDTYGFWGINIREKTGIPVVHECHDIGYYNTSASNAQLSELVMRGVDKIISVGEGMNDYLESKYHVGNKCHIVYAYPNKDMLPAVSSKVPTKYYHGVYQGGINLTFVKDSHYNHRYYKEVFGKLVAQGLKISVYPARPMKGDYGMLNVNFKSHIPDIKKLYSAISKFSFGFVGYNKTPSDVMDIAAPNKLFEFLSCGLPILAMDYNRIGKFVRENNVGVVVDKGTLKLPSKFHERMAEAKKNVLKRRKEFIMEKQAPAIYKLYRDVIG